ncbi:hypothetical protein RND71_015058 [Anisodus tanguticus]|uniref:LOB domain-containing protein n=1 Tax=Anisodus tanguticus TaxID=243964 RepID=A0AAE1VEN2_9SOLA|nr:hypothetical protein RND71_015058 [Anisodus tanguticus]
MTGSSCGACKFLRRRCSSECIFAPYFSYEDAANHFAAVHKVFGASNVSKLLLHLPLHCRSEAVITISYEALARMHDPIYGCVASLIEEIEIMENQMAICSGEDNINTLQFSLEYNNLNLENNHSITLSTRVNDTSVNEAFATHMLNAELPEINGFSFPFFDLDISERDFEGPAPTHQSAFAILSDWEQF